MGAISHQHEQARRAIGGAHRPPNERRRCQGVTIREGYWRYPMVNGRQQLDAPPEWVERREDPCRNGASAWMPEVSYCAHHMPASLVALAGYRAQLWASLAEDIWNQVCAEYPIPGMVTGA